MKTLTEYTKLALILAFILALGLPVLKAEASVNLRATTESGGNDLRFGRIGSLSSLSREISVRIVSTEEQQYQVFQRIVEPFTNERGEILDREVMLASSVIDSNSAGSLYLQNAEPVGYSDQLIYTSSSDGLSDSFTMVYAIDENFLDSSGNYRGQIIISVRPIGSSQQDELVINVSFEKEDTFEIDTQTSSTGDAIRLDTRDDDLNDNYIEFIISGNSGQAVKIYQEVLEFPQSDLKSLDPDDLKFSVISENGFENQFDQQSLAQREQLIYSGNPQDDLLKVNFQLNPESKGSILAGEYRGLLRYTIERGDDRQTQTIDLEINVQPVFRLDVQYPQEGMAFEKLVPRSSPQFKEVIVTVESNLGRPYMVMQNMIVPLSNEKGDLLNSEKFTLKSEVLDGFEGEANQSDFESVKEGQMALFESNSVGAPSAFRVLYRISPYDTMMPGSYRTSIRYSLEQK